MSWTCELATDAVRDLERLIDRMERDPFQGDVASLKGKAWAGLFRRRVGPHRIIFLADRSAKRVTLVRILRRTERTYRL